MLKFEILDYKTMILDSVLDRIKVNRLFWV